MHAERLTGHVDEPHGHINPIAAGDARKIQDRRLRQQAIRDVAAYPHIPVGRFEQRVPERSSAVVRELRGERHVVTYSFQPATSPSLFATEPISRLSEGFFAPTDFGDAHS